MNLPALFNTPLVQVALPVLVGLMLATHYQNKRLDDLRSDMNRRFDSVDQTSKEIRSLLFDHDQRLTRIEERTSPIHR